LIYRNSSDPIAYQYNFFFIKYKKIKEVIKGTCKVRNEIKTERNETKRNQTKRNETDQNETKPIETKRNEIFPKRNVTKKKMKNSIWHED